MQTVINLNDYIRDIPDFPKEGIVFKDITPLLKDKEAFAESINLMAKQCEGKGVEYIAGIESRGFIFGAALAKQMDIGFIPIRKKGKLPFKTVSVTYQLEYGEDVLEIHADAINPGEKVLVVDDVLATGGTVEAVCNLLAGQKADIVGLTFLMELGFLNGRQKLGDTPIYSLLTY